MAKTKKVKEITPAYTEEQQKEVLDKVKQETDKLKEERKKKLDEYERMRKMYASARDYVDITSQIEEGANYLKTYEELNKTESKSVVCTDGVKRSARHFLFLHQSCFWNTKQLQMRFQTNLLEAGITVEELEKFMDNYTNKK